MAAHLRQASHSAPSHGSFLAGVKGNTGAPSAPAAPKAKPKPRGGRANKAIQGSDANGVEEDKKPKPNYNRKLGGKISQLSTKATEIRCLQTQVQSAQTLNLI